MIETYQGVPLLGFTAASGTGKTTLLTAVIPLLSKTGIRIGCIKHTHHPFDIDRPGKDSYLLRQAGAQQILIGGRDRWALIMEADTTDEPPLNEVIGRMQLDALDLVLVEGFKLASLPKIEIHRAELGKSMCCGEEPTIIALATNQKPAPQVSVPVLDLDDPKDVARFIQRRVEQAETLQSGVV